MSETSTMDVTTGAEGPLSQEELQRMNAYWRAANYLSVGQIYLKDNPLLDRPLTLDDVKPRLPSTAKTCPRSGSGTGLRMRMSRNGRSRPEPGGRRENFWVSHPSFARVRFHLSESK